MNFFRIFNQPIEKPITTVDKLDAFTKAYKADLAILKRYCITMYVFNSAEKLFFTDLHVFKFEKKIQFHTGEISAVLEEDIKIKRITLSDESGNIIFTQDLDFVFSDKTADICATLNMVYP